MQGMRDLLGRKAGVPIPFERIGAVKIGTTVRSGEACGRRAVIVTTPTGGGYGAV
ncbi:hypothetical protein RGR602_CH03872 [Rhizobium gallicum bv. gallicum R602sp]|uniref:Uncharacterized protein n=1 Tax=Rhizobium gallicum bv. gallicum R602sp TaxID=1041138 RepID=A0A0B4X8W1_9HYPH|nr:hypothetical protein RGR602_CH03872 [Rhizobium gallicum bv. gallicum R602sp]